MKVLLSAITTLLLPEQRDEILSTEVAATLQHYLDGKIEQFCWLDSIRCDELVLAFHLGDGFSTSGDLCAIFGTQRHEPRNCE